MVPHTSSPPDVHPKGVQMITAVHTLIYSDDAPATRAFLRDVLGWPCVEDSSSGLGWLIFQTGPSEMGVHPTHSNYDGKEYTSPRHHLISLMCDDIEATCAELEQNGAVLSGAIADHGFGIGALVQVPGADPIMIYEPKHTTALDL
jgi:predicted enzyme related to lactoylglutathione lyase